MSGTTIKAVETQGLEGSVAQLLAQFNVLVANLDTITAAMDADGGITGTGFAAMVTAAKVADLNGTVIT